MEAIQRSINQLVDKKNSALSIKWNITWKLKETTYLYMQKHGGNLKMCFVKESNHKI
jgi:hypothetical protein